VPLYALQPSRRLIKLKDDMDAMRDDFIDTDTGSVAAGHGGARGGGKSMRAGGGLSIKGSQMRTHGGESMGSKRAAQLLSQNVKQSHAGNPLGTTPGHTYTFSKLTKHRLNPSIVNDKRQKLLLKANIRKLTKLTLEQKGNSRTRIVKKCKRMWRSTKLRFRTMLKFLFPLAQIMRSTEKKFGTGIASFFDLWSSIIYLNIAIFVVALLLGVLPWFFSSAALNLSSLVEWKFLLGLVGANSEIIGKSWFYYGGYASSEEESRQWNTPFGYALAVLAYYGISLLIVVYAIGTRLASVTSVDPNMKYSTGVLSMWDHQITSRQSIEALQRAIASRFAEYLRSDELKAAGKKRRNKKELVAFVIRRLVGYALTLCLLISAPIIVLLVTQYFRILNDTIPLSTSVIIVILSVLYPKLLQLAVAIEGYKDAKHANRHNIVRTYIVKLAIATSLVIRVLYPDLINLDLDSTDTSEQKCIGTEAGLVFWQLIIIDFFSSAVSNIFANIFLVRVKALVRSQDRKLEFGVSDSVNQVLYRQVLIWIGTALSPMLPLLGIVSNLLLFFIKYIMCRLTVKFPKNPMANAKSSVFNQAMLLITLIFSMIPGIAFLLKEDHTCGPFHNTSGADVISSFFATNGVLTSIPYWSSIWTAVRSPLILYICIIVLGIMLFFVLQRLRMFRGRWKLELLRVQIERMEKLELAKEERVGDEDKPETKRMASRVGFAEAIEHGIEKEKLSHQKSKQRLSLKEDDSEKRQIKENKTSFDEKNEEYESRMEDKRKESLSSLSHKIQDKDANHQGDGDTSSHQSDHAPPENLLEESEIQIQVDQEEDQIDNTDNKRRLMDRGFTQSLLIERYRESQQLTATNIDELSESSQASQLDNTDSLADRGSTQNLLIERYRESQQLTETNFDEFSESSQASSFVRKPPPSHTDSANSLLTGNYRESQLLTETLFEDDTLTEMERPEMERTGTSQSELGEENME